MEGTFLTRIDEIPVETLEHCHDGDGTLLLQNMMQGVSCRDFGFFHRDVLPKGTSFGEHLHDTHEEIYYLVSGKGILLTDGVAYPLNAGDFSVCKIGHSHGFTATEDCLLLVIGGALER